MHISSHAGRFGLFAAASAVLIGAALWPTSNREWRLGVGRAESGPRTMGTGPVQLYADDPNHLWNRLHRQLFVRVAPDGTEVGWDDVDPLLWRETRHLLAGESHGQAMRLLDEFLATNAERLVTDPLKRAVFQHDLWSVFDWLAGVAEPEPDARKALMPRMARVIRRVALTRDEIQRLPDNYAAAASGALVGGFDAADPDRPFLPANLFAPDGPWVVVGGTGPVAVQHAGEISRSAFSVIWQVPGGAAATRKYFETLWEFRDPYLAQSMHDGERRAELNPALPSVPGGTQIALARRMLLIDREGAVVPSPITEKVQLRVLLERRQHFFEVRMRRRLLFAGYAGGLEAVRPGDRAHFTFSAHGMDPLESRERMGAPGVVLQGCSTCHDARSQPTVLSVLTVGRLLRPQTLVESSHPRWARYVTTGTEAATHKSRRADWGMLQGIWHSTAW